jgi:preprotein translocase subunit SecY
MLNQITTFFSKAFSSPDIRRRIIITAIVLLVFRLAAHIPAAGIDPTSLQALFYGSPLLSLLDVFSGGTLANFSILALGLNPYINASIVMQLMTYVVPKLEELAKEGEYGQEKINQYTRFLTVPIAALQGFGMYTILKSQNVIPTLSPLQIAALIATMTAGTMFAVWLGELITEYGVKNGVSFLIFAGIAARLPVILGKSVSVLTGGDLLKVGVFILLAIGIVAVIVMINEAVRQIPIHYAKRANGNTASSYIPLRINQAGVIPIIFAVSLVLLPSLIAQFAQGANNDQIAKIAGFITQHFNPQSLTYNLVYFFLVFGFTYFYTTVVFDPIKYAENLQKSGGFIPGIRPGTETSKYLNFVLNRITLAGASFLGLIAVLPSFFQNVIGVANLAIGGTSVLIAVSVILELTREMESQLVMRKYDTYIRG